MNERDIRNSVNYKQTLDNLHEMLGEGDKCAGEAIAIINSLIPPLPEKPKLIPRIKLPNIFKKHITKDGRR